MLLVSSISMKFPMKIEYGIINSLQDTKFQKLIIGIGVKIFTNSIFFFDLRNYYNFQYRMSHSVPKNAFYPSSAIMKRPIKKYKTECFWCKFYSNYICGVAKFCIWTTISSFLSVCPFHVVSKDLNYSKNKSWQVDFKDENF